MAALKKIIFSNSIFGEAMSLLEKRDQRIGIYVVLINIGLGLLDLVGVAAIGLVASLAVVGVSSAAPNSKLNSIMSQLHLIELSFQVQAAVLAILACAVFLVRTFASVRLTRKILHFLSQRGAQLSSRLLAKIVSLPINVQNEKSVSQINFVLNDGITAITLGIVGLSLNLLSDLILLIILILGLFLLDPSIALTSFVSFGATGASMYLVMRHRAKRIGEQNAGLSMQLYTEINFLFSNYREIFVKSKLSTQKSDVDKIRTKLASTLAEQQFLPNISKYVIESSLVFIGLFVSAIQFILYDALHAVSALSIFLAAGSRLVPTVMRMQQNAIQIKANSGVAEKAFSLIRDVNSVDLIDLVDSSPDFHYEGFNPKIEFINCSFNYDSFGEFAIKNISIQIQPGEQIAIVGPSGSGKSTFTDLLLGILIPTSGEIRISGLNPRAAIKKWPGAMGYVPQIVQLSRGTLEQNISKGFSLKEIDLSRIENLIEMVKLQDLQKNLVISNRVILDQGVNVSGGQKQLIGIARSLFPNPKLLVLDEATSALDGQTENFISQTIKSLKGKVTVVMIAHRLSTVRDADKIIYMSKGKIVASGSIEEVRALVPDFDQQANLMGL